MVQHVHFATYEVGSILDLVYCDSTLRKPIISESLPVADHKTIFAEFDIGFVQKTLPERLVFD